MKDCGLPRSAILAMRALPGHANTLAGRTDISGEVARRFLPGLKAGVSTLRF